MIIKLRSNTVKDKRAIASYIIAMLAFLFAFWAIAGAGKTLFIGASCY